MTTPEELRVALGAAPSPTTSVPSAGAPTPGVALAGARVPGAPTVPDWDPIALTQVVARMAGDLFAAPPAVGAPSGPDVATPATALPGGTPAIDAAPPAAPTPPATMAAPAAPATPPATPPASPFSAPLRWEALAEPAFAPIGAFPLLDHVPADPQLADPLGFDLPHGVVPAAEPAPPPRIEPGYELQPIPPGLSLGSVAGAPFDPHVIRREFPILQERVHGKRLIWLDNSATTQKPRAVIDRLTHYYEHENSNIHRAAHTLAARATDAYEGARESVRRFVNAPSVQDVVFVRGATEGINLVAQSWGRRHVGEGDEIVITWLEHHANIVPWQQLCAEKGARLRIAPVDDRGQIILDEYEKLLGPRTRLVALTQVSNALGTITPAREMIELAHRHGARVLLDGAQAVSHLRVDVQALDCDFYVFSGHKVFAPTGIGAVIGKREVLEAMPPWQGGGNMIQDVTFEHTRFHGPPARFEAGTGNIADAIGLGAALDWLARVGIEQVSHHEHALLTYGSERLLTVPGLTLIGTAADKAGVLSFVLAGQKTEQVGGLLDKDGIAVRSGHHCAQPILRRFGVEATVRASLAPYNTCEDLDELVAALHRLQAGRSTSG